MTDATAEYDYSLRLRDKFVLACLVWLSSCTPEHAWAVNFDREPSASVIEDRRGWFTKGRSYIDYDASGQIYRATPYAATASNPEPTINWLCVYPVDLEGSQIGKEVCATEKEWTP
jgi:hypothetical protein